MCLQVLAPYSPLGNWQKQKRESEFLWHDAYSQESYRGEPLYAIGCKCLALAIVAPVIYTSAAIVNVAFKIHKIILLAPFWMPETRSKPFSKKITLLLRDLGIVMMTPWIILAIEIAALYGILNPLDGRKLISNFQRLLFGKTLCTPCMNPVSNTEVRLIKKPPLPFRIQCLQLAILTPLIDLPLAAFFTACRIAKVALFVSFWWPSGMSCSLYNKMSQWTYDVSLVLLTPAFFVSMEVALLYGMIIGNSEAKVVFSILEKTVLGKPLFSSWERYFASYWRELAEKRRLALDKS